MITILILVFTYFQTVYAQPNCSGTKPTTTSNIIFKSSTDGNTWDDISAGLPIDIKPFSVAVADNKVFIGADQAMYRLNIGQCNSLWQKELFLKDHFIKVMAGKGGAYGLHFEDGIMQRMPPTGFWLPIYTTFDVKSVITILEMTDNIVLIGCDRGIFKSYDAGITWKQVFDGDFVVTFIQKEGVVFAESKDRLLRSINQGESWAVILKGDGMPLKTVVHQGNTLTVNRVNNSRNNVSSNLDETSSKLRISDDNGKSWKSIDVCAFPGQMIYDLESCGAYLYVSTYSGIFRSGDMGKSWQIVLPDNGKELFKIVSFGNTIYVTKILGGC